MNDTKAQPHSIMYSRFEEAFLRWVDLLPWAEIAGETESSSLKQLRSELAAANAAIEKNDKILQRLQRLLLGDDEPPATLVDTMKDAELKRTELAGQKLLLEKQLDDLERNQQPLADSKALRDVILAGGDRDSRLRLRTEIRRRVSRIEIYFERREFPVVRVNFTNGASRFMVIGRKGEISTLAFWP